MKKLFRRMNFILVCIFMLLTSSGCFRDTMSGVSSNAKGPVDLVSMPATNTIRFMDESLYVGYIGAQRDFALIVDNGGYTSGNKTQGCGAGDIGCSSVLTQLIVNNGIKTTNYTGVAGGQNLLIYYVTSTTFDTFGDNSNSWYSFLTPDYNSDFANDDAILSQSCGYLNNRITKPDQYHFCSYSKEMSEKGYSNKAGNAMILLFEKGHLYSIVTDNDLDKDRRLDKGNTKIDDLNFATAPSSKKKVFDDYYQKIIDSFKGKITVSNATHTTATTTGNAQDINVLNTLDDLEDLVKGRKGVKDYLLLITSDGFIDTKIGTDYFYQASYDSDNQLLLKSISENTFGMTFGESVKENAMDTLLLLFNSTSLYLDNCALESEPLLNFLKETIQTILSGVIAGAYIGSLVGSFIPVIGTAAGAGIGAAVGALISVFSNMGNKGLDDRMKSNNGISDKSYCKIVESALNGIEINVPIYTYKIKSANNNIIAYKDGKMNDQRLKEYYDSNRSVCLTQNYQVNVPNGLLSLVTDVLNTSYDYADACQKTIVENIVGGFRGSPSLQLYLNNKRADELNGRVTTELVNEMMSVWGLKSIGDMYTLESYSNLDRMSVTFGSAQSLSNVKYCISDSKAPNCDGYETKSVPLNSTYVQAMEPSKGVTLEFTDIYKDMSNKKTEGLFTDNLINAMTLNAVYDDGYYYYDHDIGSDDSWNKKTNVSDSDLTGLLSSFKESMKNRDKSNTYQIKYNGRSYLISGNEVYGYTIDENGSMKLIYYSSGVEGEKEYIFGSLENDKEEASYDRVYNHKLKTATGNGAVQIDSAHDFYVYIYYDVPDPQDDSEMKTIYYTYMI